MQADLWRQKSDQHFPREKGGGFERKEAREGQPKERRKYLQVVDNFMFLIG